METLEQDAFEPPVIDSWRRSPSRDQVAYAKDLCLSELPYAERIATINDFPRMSSHAMAELIDELRTVRQRRMARLRRSRRRRAR